MDNFGLGEAAKHIGTPQSIAIRNPDCAVATHLMSLVISLCDHEKYSDARLFSKFLTHKTNPKPLI